MSDGQEKVSLPEQPVFGKNGEVLNRGAFRPWRDHISDPPEADTLRVAYPGKQRIWLAWLFAGLLNPTLAVWGAVIAFGQPGDLNYFGLFWLISLPSAIAAGIGVLFARKREAYSLRYIIKLSIRAWVLVSASTIGLMTILCLFVIPAFALLVVIFGILITLIFGAPAALAGAFVVRIIVFRRRTALPIAPLSTP